MRRSLLGDGWPGLCDAVGATLAAGVSAAGQAAVDDLVGYFAKHTERLGYYGRLQAGRSIGSGAVEGLARRMGDRLKTPGRGWREDHLDPMATLGQPRADARMARPLETVRQLIAGIESYTQRGRDSSVD